MIPGLSLIDKIISALPENSLLRRECGELRSQLDLTLKRIAELEAQVTEQQRKIDVHEKLRERLDDQAEKILFFFFDEDRKLSAESIAKRFQIQTSAAKQHFDDLVHRDFIFLAAPAKLVRRLPSNGGTRTIPTTYQIAPKGRAYTAKHKG